MGKLPYFPCYARDVISSNKIAAMSGDAFKAYWMLLCASWLEDERATLPNPEANPQANSQANIAALARVSLDVWLTVKDEVLACFKETSTGRLYNERLMEISSLLDKRSKAGSKGGSKTQAKRQAKRAANTQASESESDIEAESESDPKNEEKKENKEKKETIENSVFLEYKHVLDKDSQGIYLETKNKKRLRGKMLEAFFRFWDAFGYKHGLRGAADSWLKIKWPETKEERNKLFFSILKAAKDENTYRSETIAKGGIPKMAQGWITAQRWEDESDV